MCIFFQKFSQFYKQTSYFLLQEFSGTQCFKSHIFFDSFDSKDLTQIIVSLIQLGLVQFKFSLLRNFTAGDLSTDFRLCDIYLILALFLTGSLMSLFFLHFPRHFHIFSNTFSLFSDFQQHSVMNLNNFSYSLNRDQLQRVDLFHLNVLLFLKVCPGFSDPGRVTIGLVFVKAKITYMSVLSIIQESLPKFVLFVTNLSRRDFKNKFQLRSNSIFYSVFFFFFLFFPSFFSCL